MRKRYGKDKRVEELNGFKHRDLIKYTKKDGSFYVGYITAMYPERKVVNISTLDGQILKRYGVNRCNLLWRYNKIYWF